ncbi:factor associated with metabolism and energy [Excalfactoria chinensis]|uniref:factor associated with metabolism and energy n=1 Tax=Excalfactoria chinensis TaxID=46218 RepID=UPI003B3A2A36
MGLSSSKTHPRVTQVVPMRSNEEVLGEPRLHPTATTEHGHPITHGQLPPLRQTGYGRASTGPLDFNTVPENGASSIIKLYPPRRPQRLEPAGTPRGVTAVKPWSQKGVDGASKAKTLEKKGQSLRAPPGRRQHLHKMQMLDLMRRRREAELKRDLHREAKVSKHTMEELGSEMVLDTLHRGDNARSQELIPAEHNQHFNGHPGNRGDGFAGQHTRSSKVGLWFCKEPRSGDLLWDSSSTDSEDWEREEKQLYRRPPLVRTRTERVSLFDNFFDKEF